MKLKIKINRVDPETKTHRGLFGNGCKGSNCNDECCEWGCDVDLSTLRLILKYRRLVEPLVGTKLEECFSTKLVKDDDYAGGAYRETAVRDGDGRCAFHFNGKRGCSLYYLWETKGLPKRIIPTICRIYPLTWHRGRLLVDSPVIDLCKCREKAPEGVKEPSLFETQKKEVRALFDIENKSWGKTFCKKS